MLPIHTNPSPVFPIHPSAPPSVLPVHPTLSNRASACPNTFRFISPLCTPIPALVSYPWDRSPNLPSSPYPHHSTNSIILLAYRGPQPVHIRPNPIGIKTLPCAVPYLFPPTPVSRPFPPRCPLLCARFSFLLIILHCRTVLFIILERNDRLICNEI
jgi:hypothetical protein